MDDFRLDPISPYDSYRDDRQPSASGDRRKPKPPKSQTAGEDEVILNESGANGPTDEAGAAIEDYYSPSDRTKPSE
jgi:hypothetical protein